MAGRAEVDVNWPTCDRGDCIGVRLETGTCLVHAEDLARKTALEQVAQSGKVDARGWTISGELLDELLAAVPSEPDGRRKFAGARFDGAIFMGEARFDGATFMGEAKFDGATFMGEAKFDGVTFQSYAEFGETTFTRCARFNGATFSDTVWFDLATFQDDAGFDGTTFRDAGAFSRATFEGRAGFITATFKGSAQFGGATFRGNADFDRTTFSGYAGFGRATFQRDAGFGSAIFQDDASFGGAAFQDVAKFQRATFERDAGFNGANFQRDAWFAAAVFERTQQFGPALACWRLNFDGAQFSQLVVIEVSARDLTCRRTRFPAGVQFRLRWARVVLDDTDLSVPSLLTGIPHLADDQLAEAERVATDKWQREYGKEISEEPRILSLRRANLAALGLSNVSLAECRFAGAHNLDLMRLDGDITLDLSPARAGWERRQVIAEEAEWRASRDRRGRWQASWPSWAGDKPEPLDPGTIAGIYRALRKGREDVKDEPGAADSYYGEMEMRRHTTGRASERENGSRGQVDRSVLTAYWLASGYGLRAWRAFAWFAGVTAVFALLFHVYGFIRPPTPDNYWTSLLYSFRSTLSLSDDAVTLNAWGELLQALLRITGPVLLGLGLLALRGRVKR